MEKICFYTKCDCCEEFVLVCMIFGYDVVYDKEHDIFIVHTDGEYGFAISSIFVDAYKIGDQLVCVES